MTIIHTEASVFAMISTTMRFLSLMVLAALPLLLADQSSAQEQYAVIVNRDNPVTSLSQIQAKKMFLMTNDRWSNSKRVMPVEIEDPSEARSSFIRAVLGMNETAYKRHWIEVMYQHAIMPPKKVDTEAQVIEFVSRNAGAIGFVSSGKLKASDNIKSVFKY